MTTCTSRAAWLNLLRRLHFYIGLFIGPFIFVAALTGTLYVATPQLENWLYHEALQGSLNGERQPLSAQIAVAKEATQNNLRLQAVRPGITAGETTRVMFADPRLGESENRAIFVDPVTLRVKGDLTVYGTSGILPLASGLITRINPCCWATAADCTANWRPPGCGLQRWAVLRYGR